MWKSCRISILRILFENFTLIFYYFAKNFALFARNLLWGYFGFYSLVDNIKVFEFYKENFADTEI